MAVSDIEPNLNRIVGCRMALVLLEFVARCPFLEIDMVICAGNCQEIPVVRNVKFMDCLFKIVLCDLSFPNIVGLQIAIDRRS